VVQKIRAKSRSKPQERPPLKGFGAERQAPQDRDVASTAANILTFQQAEAIEDEHERAAAFANLAPILTDPQLIAAISNIGTFQSKEAYWFANVEFAKQLTKKQLCTTLVAAMALGVRRDAFCIFGTVLKNEDALEKLSAAVKSDPKTNEFYVLSNIGPKSSAEMADMGLTAIENSDLSPEREYALHSLVEFVPHAEVDRALALAQGFRPSILRSRIIARLRGERWRLDNYPFEEYIPRTEPELRGEIDEHSRGAGGQIERKMPDANRTISPEDGLRIFLRARGIAHEQMDETIAEVERVGIRAKIKLIPMWDERPNEVRYLTAPAYLRTMYSFLFGDKGQMEHEDLVREHDPELIRLIQQYISQRTRRGADDLGDAEGLVFQRKDARGRPPSKRPAANRKKAAHPRPR
jgi:hypothetical protein